MNDPIWFEAQVSPHGNYKAFYRCERLSNGHVYDTPVAPWDGDYALAVEYVARVQEEEEEMIKGATGRQVVKAMKIVNDREDVRELSRAEYAEAIRVELRKLVKS